MILFLIFQGDAITARSHPTILVITSCKVIDVIAVADVKASLGAIPPERALNESWKSLRKSSIEGPSIDLVGDHLQDISTAVRGIALRTIGMVGLEATQDSS